MSQSLNLHHAKLYHQMIKRKSIPVRSMPVPLSSLPLPSANISRFPTSLLLTKRLVERAGGTRFVKGLKGEDFQIWRGVCEGLRASREDIESAEARLDEDVRQFEQGVRTADVTTATQKVAWQTDHRSYKSLKFPVARPHCVVGAWAASGSGVGSALARI